MKTLHDFWKMLEHNSDSMKNLGFSETATIFDDYLKVARQRDLVSKRADDVVNSAYKGDFKTLNKLLDTLPNNRRALIIPFLAAIDNNQTETIDLLIERTKKLSEKQLQKFNESDVFLHFAVYKLLQSVISEGINCLEKYKTMSYAADTVEPILKTIKVTENQKQILLFAKHKLELLGNYSLSKLLAIYHPELIRETMPPEPSQNSLESLDSFCRNTYSDRTTSQTSIHDSSVRSDSDLHLSILTDKLTDEWPPFLVSAPRTPRASSNININPTSILGGSAVKCAQKVRLTTIR